jgi:type I restriction enzyme S subunit
MSEAVRNIEVPDGWVSVPLADCAGILDSRRIPLNSKERSARIEGKSQDQLFPYYGATGQVGFIDDFIFEGEHLLIGEDGAPFFDKSKNVAYIAKGKFWVNNHAHILQALDGVTSNKYLLHYLNKFNYEGFVGGTTRLKLNQGNLKLISVPLAPLEQQKRIVAKIEELFSHIDAGIEALKKAKQLLKQYRQSVLKAAVTGELTKEWRETNKDKLEPASQLLERILKERRQKWEEQQLEQFKAKGKMPKDDKWKAKYKQPVSLRDWAFLSEIPDSWSWVSVGQIGDSQDQPVLTGPFGSNLGKGDFTQEGVPVLTIGCLQEEGIDLNRAMHVSKKKAEELERYQLKEGDMLFSRMAAVGRAGFVTPKLV